MRRGQVSKVTKVVQFELVKGRAGNLVVRDDNGRETSAPVMLVCVFRLLSVVVVGACIARVCISSPVCRCCILLFLFLVSVVCYVFYFFFY